MYPDKFVNKPSDIPTEEHFAIFEADAYTCEDYGQTDRITFVSYEAYLTKEKLIKCIQEKDNSAYVKDYRVCRVIPMKVEKTISVTVG